MPHADVVARSATRSERAVAAPRKGDPGLGSLRFPLRTAQAHFDSNHLTISLARALPACEHPPSLRFRLTYCSRLSFVPGQPSPMTLDRGCQRQVYEASNRYGVAPAGVGFLRAGRRLIGRARRRCNRRTGRKRSRCEQRGIVRSPCARSKSARDARDGAVRGASGERARPSAGRRAGS